MAGLRLHLQILIALLLAVGAGLLAGETATVAGLPVHGIFDFLGTVFISALKMLIVPLVSSSIIVGVAGAGAGRSLGRLGGRAASFFLITTISAVLMGIVMVSVFEPGIAAGRPVGDRLPLEGANADLAEELADKGFGDMLDVFLSIVPTNVISAAGVDDLLGIVFFSALWGGRSPRPDSMPPRRWSLSLVSSWPPSSAMR
jgi:Na+/H+-dicarboxylate symporter